MHGFAAASDSFVRSSLNALSRRVEFATTENLTLHTGYSCGKSPVPDVP
jgi:hypothetical protein